LREDSPILRHLYAKGGDVRRDIALQGDRLRSGEGAVLVARLGFNLLLGAALLIIGGKILSGDRGWAEVAVYVVVMRYVLKDFGAIGKFMNGVSRQFRALDYYIRFVRSASLADLEPTIKEWPSGPLTLRAKSLSGDEDELVLEPGRNVAVVSHDRNLRPSVLVMAHSKTPDREPAPIAWIDGVLLEEELSLAANLALSPGMNTAELEASAAQMAPPDDAVPFRSGWSTRPIPRLPTPPPEWLVCAFKAAVAERRGAIALATDGATAQNLPDTWATAWPTVFTRGPLFVVHRDLREAGKVGEETVLLVEDGRIRVWSPLTDETRRLLALPWRKIVERIRAGVSQSEDNDADEVTEL
jgi:hypothetical protein